MKGHENALYECAPNGTAVGFTCSITKFGGCRRDPRHIGSPQPTLAWQSSTSRTHTLCQRLLLSARSGLSNIQEGGMNCLNHAFYPRKRLPGPFVVDGRLRNYSAIALKSCKLLMRLIRLLTRSPSGALSYFGNSLVFDPECAHSLYDPFSPSEGLRRKLDFGLVPSPNAFYLFLRLNRPFWLPGDLFDMRSLGWYWLRYWLQPGQGAGGYCIGYWLLLGYDTGLQLGTIWVGYRLQYWVAAGQGTGTGYDTGLLLGTVPATILGCCWGRIPATILGCGWVGYRLRYWAAAGQGWAAAGQGTGTSYDTGLLLGRAGLGRVPAPATILGCCWAGYRHRLRYWAAAGLGCCWAGYRLRYWAAAGARYRLRYWAAAGVGYRLRYWAAAGARYRLRYWAAAGARYRLRYWAAAGVGYRLRYWAAAG
ncbi:hypothetical protein B0H16DRAFT_1464893 [Mycena metata]|uniref:Uncharacterized protein n=1 Tax=Mycena metata TaxID=1033252 RepID=A0AAD7N0J0_9AGAR|nr:hypothetical protein B0H16DRAFT_1464893 [Mycena metata]